MCLFLFAISFVHFGSEHPRQAWSGEIALHHAGLPLALFVLLQDYRFLLLDAFLRFVVNASLTAGAILLCIPVIRSPELLRHFEHPFDAGLLFVAACLLLTLFVYIRNRIQRLLTRVIFLRSNIEEVLREFHHLGRASPSDEEFLSGAVESIARFLRADQFLLIEEPPGETVSTPSAVLDPANWRLPSWVQAVVPLRLSRGDTRLLLLGPRQGGRRYLSEDYEVLARLGSAVVEHVEQRRGMELQNLVSEAELRALQAQINPHFLFNSFNTLYGTIARDNTEARRLVLNLADVFRYFLRADRPFIRVEEEMRIVRAYIEIEELRLGSKLRTELAIDNSALAAVIPVLSIQPLVENAIKHGVAARAGNGFVRVSIKCESDLLSVKVSNSGEFDKHITPGGGPGIGLANVRRRLALCYGESAGVEVHVANGVTTVGFALQLSARPVHQEVKSIH
jgi:two-component system, LytTR family, sensor kinase